MLKSNISEVYSPKDMKIKITSYSDLLLEKMNNVIILIKAVFGKNIHIN